MLLAKFYRRYYLTKQNIYDLHRYLNYFIWIEKKEKPKKTTDMFCETNSDAHIKKVGSFDLNAANFS